MSQVFAKRPKGEVLCPLLVLTEMGTVAIDHDHGNIVIVPAYGPCHDGDDEMMMSVVCAFSTQ